MNTTIKVAIAAGAITLAALSVWGACGFTRHLIIAVDRWGAAAPTAGKTDAVLDHINRPCKGASGPDACGTLAQINKTAIDAGDAIVTTQLQERAATPHVIAAMDTFRDAAVHLSGTADSLSGTATALTGTAQAATSTIGTAGTTIAALQPLVGHVDSAVTSLDTSLQTTSLDLDAVLQHTEAITSSAAKVSDHFEKMIDAPKKHTFWGDVKAGWQIIWQVAMLAK